MPETAAALKNAVLKNEADKNAPAREGQPPQGNKTQSHQAQKQAAISPVPDHTAAWQQALNLHCELTVEVPLPGFKVGDLARLAARVVIPSQWRVGDDVPLRINGQLIAWSEFEVVHGRLAARITELR
jgi:flagellar motor switch/type III secretory pathway protein FliN